MIFCPSVIIRIVYIWFSLAPVVQIDSGPIVGAKFPSKSGAMFNYFKGIPFAEPPINDLRFEVIICKFWNFENFKSLTETHSCSYIFTATKTIHRKMDGYQRYGFIWTTLCSVRFLVFCWSHWIWRSLADFPFKLIFWFHMLNIRLWNIFYWQLWFFLQIVCI